MSVGRSGSTSAQKLLWQYSRPLLSGKSSLASQRCQPRTFRTYLGTLPTTQRAAVLTSPGPNFKFSVRDVPVPEPSPSEVLVRLSVSGVCESDLSLASGIFGTTRDILGHEGIGRIVKLGADVKPSRVLRIGQRVGVGWQRDMCGHCEMCRHDGGETRCLEQITSGRKVDGTFAEFTIVPQSYVTPLPEGVPDDELAPILCAGVTAYKAIKISQASPGAWVAIVGTGGVGAFGVQYARAMGFRVLAIDQGAEIRQYCMDLGADAFIDFTQEADMSQAGQRATGTLGVSVAIVTSGAMGAYQTGMSILGGFGKLVCVGVPPPSAELPISPTNFVALGHEIIGSSVGTRSDIAEAVDFVQRGLVRSRILPATLHDLNEVVQNMHSQQRTGKYVLRIAEDDLP